MEVLTLEFLTKPNIRKALMRLRLEDNSFGFWIAPTTQGISMGPVIPGEEHIHLTFFDNGEVFNAHLTIRKHGKKQYKPLTVMNSYQFQHQLKQTATNVVNSFQPINPNQNVIFTTNRGYKLFEKLISGSLTITHKGRTLYFDLDFGTMLDRIQNFTEDPMEYLRIGKAYNMLNSSPSKFGLTKQGTPILPINNQLYAWGTIHGLNQNTLKTQQSDSLFGFLTQTSWGRPIYELTSIFGVPQLFLEIEQRKLFGKWITALQ